MQTGRNTDNGFKDRRSLKEKARGIIVCHDVCPHCGKKLNRRRIVLFGKSYEVTDYGSCGCEESKYDGVDIKPSERKYVNAGIPQRYLRAVSDLGSCTGDVMAGRSLYLYGPYGSGKTRFACALAKSLIDKGVFVRFVNSGHLMAEIKGIYDGRPTDALDKAYACRVLVLDDLGKEQPTEHSIAMLYELIDSRYMAGKPIIVTSNFARDELLARLGRDIATAESIVSRLCEDSTSMYMGGNDRRLS